MYMIVLVSGLVFVLGILLLEGVVIVIFDVIYLMNGVMGYCIFSR